MNLFVKLMMLALVLAVAGPLFITGPDGKPLMDLKSFSPTVAGITDTATEKANLDALGNGKTKVYKWQDQNGVWQISDQPPMDALLAEEAQRRQDQQFGSAGMVATNNSPNSTKHKLSGPSANQNTSNNTQASNPRGSVKVQEFTVDANANIVQSLPKNEINKALGRANTQDAPAGGSETVASGPKGSGKGDTPDVSIGALTTISPSQISQLFKDTHEVKKIMEARNAQLDAIGKD